MAIVSAAEYANSDVYKEAEQAANAYRNKQAGITPTPAVTQRQNNTAQSIINGLMERYNRPVQQFKFNPDKDAGFQAQKAIIAQDTARDMAAARVRAGASGMRNGSLQTNQLAQVSATNQSRLQNEALPAAFARAYGQFQDQRQAEQQQANGQMSLAEYMARQDQNKFSNDLALRQEDRQTAQDAYKQKQDRIDLAKWGINTYGYGEAKDDYGVFMDQYQDATPLAVQQLKRQNEVQDAGITGYYNDSPTLAREQFQAGQDQQDIENQAQYLGMYKGMPTMQKIVQEANLKNITADNARAAAAEARAAGNQQLANLFDIWDRTQKAPAGIPGVAEGTPIAGKQQAPETAETYVKYFDGAAKYDDNGKLTNPDTVESTILMSNLPEEEMRKLYARYGLKWGG